MRTKTIKQTTHPIDPNEIATAVLRFTEELTAQHQLRIELCRATYARDDARCDRLMRRLEDRAKHWVRAVNRLAEALYGPTWDGDARRFALDLFTVEALDEDPDR